jgi:hypothetical protein
MEDIKLIHGDSLQALITPVYMQVEINTIKETK